MTSRSGNRTNPNPELIRVKEERIQKCISLMMAKPRTIAELAAANGASECSARRWIRHLSDLGYLVTKSYDRPHTYSIT